MMIRNEETYVAQSIDSARCRVTGFKILVVSDINGFCRRFLLPPSVSMELLNESAFIEKEKERRKIIESNLGGAK